MKIYRYKAFGLCIKSQLQIHFLDQIEFNSHDVELKECEDLSLPSKEYFDLPNYAEITASKSIFYKNNVGLFEINNPDYIKYKVISHENMYDFSRVLLGLPLGYFIHSDRLVLHGSAISKKDSAFGFIGKSGTGKSSLALECLENGCNFLTEDILVIEDKSIRPSFPFLKSNEHFLEKYKSSLHGKKYTFDSDHLNRVGMKINDSKFAVKNTKINKLVLLCSEEKSKNLLYKENDRLKLFKLIFKNTLKPNPLYIDRDHTKVVMDSIMKLIDQHEFYIADFSFTKIKERNKQIIKLICS